MILNYISCMIFIKTLSFHVHLENCVLRFYGIRGIQRISVLLTHISSCFQLAVVMWLLTYVGAVFNGITILILGRPNIPLLAPHLNLRVFFRATLLHIWL